MARTVNVEIRQVRREAFLDVAERLILEKGYDAMSVQDVLEQLETSKGAFYHYFDSKQALLDGVVERFAERGMAGVRPILDDPELAALRKLELFMAGLARYKAEQKDFVLRLVSVLLSDGNSLFREKVRRETAAWLRPVMTAVIEQGIAEGTIRVDDPEASATVAIAMIQGYQDVATRHFAGCLDGSIPVAEVLRTLAAFTAAFERALGIRPGSVILADRATIEFWFGPAPEGGSR